MCSVTSSPSFLAGLRFSFVPKRIFKAQRKILVEKIVKFGGSVDDQINSSTTHVLFHRSITFEEGLASMKLAALPESAVAVEVDWIPACIAERKLLSTVPFQVTQASKINANNEQPNSNDIYTDIVGKYSGSVQLRISGTSKFEDAKLVTNSNDKPNQLLIRKTFVCGSKYGLGVFGLFSVGERQIGWIPEKDKAVFSRVESMMEHQNLHVSLERATTKRLTENFEKIDIDILCSLGGR